MTSEEDQLIEDFGHEEALQEEESIKNGPGIAVTPSKKQRAKLADSADENGNEEDLIQSLSKDFSQWTFVGDSTFIGIGDTIKGLHAGVYTIDITNTGTVLFQKKTLYTDELFEFKDSIIDGVIKEIEKFWDSKEIFKRFGFLHRRGFMLYGKQGCGKSGTIQLIVKKIVERDGIVILCDSPNRMKEGLKVLRKIEPHRHLVCIFEDIDAIIRHHNEEEILSMLDGEDQIDDVLNIATTNYPERLDKRIVARPRRFDRLIKILPPSAIVRREYFSKKFKVTDEELDQWVEASNDFTFAAMTDLVISVKVLGYPFDESIKKLQDLILKRTPSSEDFNGTQVGFGNK